MSVIVPDTHRDLITPPYVVCMATIMPDGMPQLSLVWCRYEDEHLLVSLEKDSQKHRNLMRNPRTAIISKDQKNPWRYVEMRGLSTAIYQADSDWVDDLCVEYTGEKYFGVILPEDRKDDIVITKIKPIRVRVGGFSTE